MPTSARALVPIVLVFAVAAVALLAARGSQGTPGSRAEQRDTDGPRPIVGGSYEASGLVAIPGESQFLFVDDGREREIFLVTLDARGVQTGSTSALPFAADVTDMEGATTDGRAFYVVGSQSKRTGFEGDGLVRFAFDSRTKRIGNVQRVQGLKAWLAAHVDELRGTERRIGDDVLNIEGLAWDPRNGRMLIGLRAPVVADSALVLAIRVPDADSAFSAAGLRMDGPAIRLPLGGAGIRGIEWDPAAGAFLVIAGASLDEESRDFSVYQWDGHSRGALRQLTTYDRRLKPEGIARAGIGTPGARIVVFDVGRIGAMRD